jgi:hypothetical protein
MDREVKRDKMREYRKKRKEREGNWKERYTKAQKDKRQEIRSPGRCAICWGNCPFVFDTHISNPSMIEFDYFGRRYMAHIKCVAGFEKMRELLATGKIYQGMDNERKLTKNEQFWYDFTVKFFRVMGMLHKKSLLMPGSDYLRFTGYL